MFFCLGRKRFIGKTKNTKQQKFEKNVFFVLFMSRRIFRKRKKNIDPLVIDLWCTTFSPSFPETMWGFIPLTPILRSFNNSSCTPKIYPKRGFSLKFLTKDITLTKIRQILLKQSKYIDSILGENFQFSLNFEINSPESSQFW